MSFTETFSRMRSRLIFYKTGVGAGLKPPQYLVPGTVMEVIIEKIGTLRNGVDFAS